MKKQIAFLILIFLILTTLVCFCPAVTDWDRRVIVFVQNILSGFPSYIPVLAGGGVYIALTLLPVVVGNVYFLKNRLWVDALIFTLAPVLAYLLNTV